MSWKQGLLLGLAIFLISIVVRLPAALLAGPLAEQNIFAQGLSGSIWSGRAAALSAKVNGQIIPWGEVSWSLAPMSLLSLAPTLDFRTQLGQQSMAGRMLVASTESVTLTRLTGQLPASLARLFAPVSLGGQLIFEFDELLWGKTGGIRRVEGTLIWRDATWVSSIDRVPLGVYQLSLSSSEDTIRGVLSSSAGTVFASGELEYAGGDYAVNLLVQPEGYAQQRLRQTLALIAQPEGDAFRIKLAGQL